MFQRQEQLASMPLCAGGAPRAAGAAPAPAPAQAPGVVQQQVAVAPNPPVMGYPQAAPAVQQLAVQHNRREQTNDYAALFVALIGASQSRIAVPLRLLLATSPTEYKEYLYLHGATFTREQPCRSLCDARADHPQGRATRRRGWSTRQTGGWCAPSTASRWWTRPAAAVTSPRAGGGTKALSRSAAPARSPSEFQHDLAET